MLEIVPEQNDQRPHGVRSMSPNVLATLIGIATTASASTSSGRLSNRNIDEEAVVTERWSIDGPEGEGGFCDNITTRSA